MKRDIRNERRRDTTRPKTRRSKRKGKGNRREQTGESEVRKIEKERQATEWSEKKRDGVGNEKDLQLRTKLSE